ncbi:hypothetical protein L596_008603 [Steinernema carpocapsae]|uniref:Uncharacterized protein n=1 Tax=Steinernema carpocapsae TaxID=34508 RepID=A0A4U5PE38_STECR|nr:hypothetical protein L596_008603 [Steinernema carpocapsae]
MKSTNLREHLSEVPLNPIAILIQIQFRNTKLPTKRSNDSCSPRAVRTKGTVPPLASTPPLALPSSENTSTRGAHFPTLTQKRLKMEKTCMQRAANFTKLARLFVRDELRFARFVSRRMHFVEELFGMGILRFLAIGEKREKRTAEFERIDWIKLKLGISDLTKAALCIFHTAEISCRQQS